METGTNCTVWRERTQAWLRGEGEPGDREAIAAHRGSCPECQQYYRDTVELLARMRQGETRLVAQSPARERGRGRRKLWIALALPVFALLLWNTVKRDVAPREEGLLAEGSGARVDGRALAAQTWVDAPENSALETDANSRVRLELPAASAQFQGSTRCLLERKSPLRLRVLSGRIRVRGDAKIISNLAELELSGGDAELECDGATVRVRSHATGVKLTDTTGTRLLPPGEERVLDR
jgi:hypothetical protein